MTPHATRLVKDSAALLADRAEELTRLFYVRMFEENPEVKPFFNHANQLQGTQQRALAGAIIAYASNIDNLTALGGAVELIAQKHMSLGIQREHYPIVGKHLLGAIRELLGDLASEELVGAWGEAYQQLADIMINRESELYEQQLQIHGWTGFRDFQVSDKVRESAEITSFYLTPLDGKPIGKHRPGQYITIRLPMQDADVNTTMRNYSISSAPGEEYLRISVKREAGFDGAPAGYASCQLHDGFNVGDRIEVAPPAGEFVLETAADATRPIVLMSGGVGITPLLSMLHAAVQEDVPRNVVFIHAARNGDVHAFAHEVDELASQCDRVTVHYRYSESSAQDAEAGNSHSVGFIDQELLERFLPGPNADFYFCGPAPFMDAMESLLRGWGVEESRIRFESFGPSRTLTSIPADSLSNA